MHTSLASLPSRSTLGAIKTIELIWFNAGGGHRAAAQALERVIRDQERPWRVRHANLMQVIDPKGAFRRFTGMEPEDLYNKRLASGFTLGLTQELKVLQRAIRWGHSAMVKRLTAHWHCTRPDLVVSLIPNFNRAMHDSLALARPGVPFVTVLTDMADYPPHFWIEPDLAQHVVCGTDHAVAQALAAGCKPGLVHRSSGMILRPDFYAAALGQRVADRVREGLDAHTPTGLVLFGGTGSRAMKGIAARLPDVPLILMCGRNATLADALRALPARAPRVVVGFTTEVARWMGLADFFIGKPGPGSLSEAVQCGLPVIVTLNPWTMPQERWNTEWVREHGLGVVHRSFLSVRAAVDEVIRNLPEYQARVRRIDNGALHEIPQILERILDQARAPVVNVRQIPVAVSSSGYPRDVIRAARRART
ncbi:galactosyldiacylglycerol synthase [uncultured Lamprocystis sp.]|jgi:1,2-diacylglycerol 3-beta-galactosyltransferase|uniref:galactosyldiacylglycerol synthase n=1 Tax=uncultured Lamprocystis sp. TaxID=543132 RepID=UPI0025EA7DA6|nr:galactosyldiacylglycerol synthase [uncultured Lamprocystis sp.]